MATLRPLGTRPVSPNVAGGIRGGREDVDGKTLRLKLPLKRTVGLEVFNHGNLPSQGWPNGKMSIKRDLFEVCLGRNMFGFCFESSKQMEVLEKEKGFQTC